MLKKSIRNKLFKLSLSLISGTAITSCGTNFGATNVNTSYSTRHTISAQFVDSPVANLQYESLSHSGATDTGGHFQCDISEEVSFYIGALKLGSSICQRIITPQTIAAVIQQTEVPQTTTSASGTVTSNGTKTITQIISTSLPDAAQVINRVRLMMTLDVDGDASNGIQLPAWSEQSKITATSIDFNNTVNFENSVGALLQSLPSTSNRSAVGFDRALAHFSTTISLIPGIQIRPNKATAGKAVNVGNYYNTKTGEFNETSLEQQHSEFDLAHEGHS